MGETTRLAARHCKPLAAGTPALDARAAADFLAQLDGWRIEGGELRREFKFPDHHHAIAFVNAVAWISHRQDHHPDLEVGYNRVVVRYSTHSVGGLSENDFICAARVDALLS